MFMSSKEYRESLRALKPNVYVLGRQVDSIADDELFAPGVNAIGLTYDYALREEFAAVMRADGQPGGDQANPDSYVHIVETRAGGIVISGAKAIVTSAPYVHELLVMPCRNMTSEDAAFAVCCSVPIASAGLTMIARPAGRPGEPAAKFSS